MSAAPAARVASTKVADAIGRAGVVHEAHVGAGPRLLRGPGRPQLVGRSDGVLADRHHQAHGVGESRELQAVEVEDRLGVGTVPELSVVAGDAVDEQRRRSASAASSPSRATRLRSRQFSPAQARMPSPSDEAGAVRRGELDPRPPGIAEQHRVGVTGQGRRGPAHAVAVEAALRQVGHHDRPDADQVEQRVGRPDPAGAGGPTQVTSALSTNVQRRSPSSHVPSGSTPPHGPWVMCFGHAVRSGASTAQ